MPSAIVLYEDQLSPTLPFGPHEFVMACVRDAVEAPAHLVVRAIKSIPCKGNQGVLKRLNEEFEQLSRHGEHVVAVLDNDRIREAVGLDKGVDNNSVLAHIHERCGRSEDDLTVILIEQNTETILATAIECAQDAIDLPTSEIMAKALAKNRSARDLVLIRFAKQAHRAIRECVLNGMPSLAALVSMLVGLLSDLDAAPH